MNKYTIYILVGCICLLFVVIGCASNQKSAPVSITWQLSTHDVGQGFYENSFTIKNITTTPISGQWAIYFSQHPRKIRQSKDAPVCVEQICATHYKLSPTATFRSLAPGDSLVVVFQCDGEVPNCSMTPEMPYWVEVDDQGESNPLPIALTQIALPATLQQNALARTVYDNNERILAASAGTQSTLEVIPAVKQCEFYAGNIELRGAVCVQADKNFRNECQLLEQSLQSLYELKTDSQATTTICLEYLPQPTKVVNEEYYELSINGNRIRIIASTPHGIFNGTQTLLSLLKGQRNPYVLRYMNITDYPELDYRGHMIDIARNFTPVEKVKRLIDIMASYKLNVFHFHFSDDEGWRLEIPGLEELTDVSSHRGHTTDEANHLYPAYDGGFDPNAPTVGNGYYSRTEFIDLLRYAAQRHIRVIPEIESPGHARAAIVAMKARYRKYIDSDPQKANEYLLSDWQDGSKYLSAQSYSDNVMNIALPSTYRFMEKVIDELQAMYREAGVPLTAVQIGGDEVANGAWIGSPRCRAFMQEHAMTTPRELSEYFIRRVVGSLEERGIPFGGWQEVAMGRSKETDDYLSERSMGIYCWKTVAKDNMDEVVYQMANKGYPVILCNVTNFYFDLAYDTHPDEPGHYWGGRVNEAKSFSTLPYNIYLSIRSDSLTISDRTVADKVRLTEFGHKHIKGVESTLFAETIRGPKWVEYYLFPKLMGLAERGWLASPNWGDMVGSVGQTAYEQDLAFYYHRIATREMPHWEKIGLNYRLPYPGLRIEGDTLFANTLIPDAQIRYTTDGSEPTADSPRWTAPVTCSGEQIKAKLFYANKQSVTIKILL